MSKKNEGQSLEERLVFDSKKKLNSIVESARALLRNPKYSALMSDSYSFFVKWVGDIEKSLVNAQTYLDALIDQEDAAQGGQRNIIHDINNNLAGVMAASEVLIVDKQYQEILGSEYASFRSSLKNIHSGSRKIAKKLASLWDFYIAQEQGVQLVDASTLSSEKKVYVLVHIDDDESIRYSLSNALTQNSNLFPSSNGEFGHDGFKVAYKVYSYGSVDEALAAISGLGRIDSVITDRKMPHKDAYDLLNALTHPENRKKRADRYLNVANIAMLTGGISSEEAEAISEIYGISILTKPFQSLQLEQRIYNIINLRNN